jgi:hypothetical protein
MKSSSNHREIVVGDEYDLRCYTVPVRVDSLDGEHLFFAFTDAADGMTHRIKIKTFTKAIVARRSGMAAVAASPVIDRFYEGNGDAVVGLQRGNMAVEWVNLGEGSEGDYDPEDADDENLLRFDVYVVREGEHIEAEGAESKAIDDASYCTNMPATTDVGTLKAALVYLMDEVHSASASLENHPNIKKKCELLSWVSPTSAELVPYLAKGPNMEKLTIDGKQVVFYANPIPAEDGHYYPSLVVEGEGFHRPTDWDWGTDLKLVEDLCKKKNAENGYSKDEVYRIIARSMTANRRTREKRAGARA